MTFIISTYYVIKGVKMERTGYGTLQ